VLAISLAETLSFFIMPVDQKLPKGLHKYYTSDKFTDAVFWFMCGMIYGCDKGVYDAANTFREFLGLDEDSAPTRHLVQKFQRQLKQFKEVIVIDRDKISLSEDEFLQEVADEVFRRIKAHDH